MTKSEVRRQEINADAERWANAAAALKKIRMYHNDGMITTQEARTLRGQALAGDDEAALKGLARLIAGNEYR